MGFRNSRGRAQKLQRWLSARAGGHLIAVGSRGLARQRARREAVDAETEYAMGQFVGVMEAVFLSAASDGHVTRAEIGQMAEMVTDLTDGALGNDVTRTLLDEFAQALERDGFDGRIDALGDILDPDSRRTAFALAVGVALGDGELAAEEEEMFYSLAGAFEVPDAEAADIIEAVAAVVQPGE